MKPSTWMLMFVVVALLFLSGGKMRSQGPGSKLPRAVDLSGLWETDKGELVTLSQTPYSLSGQFLQKGDCPLPGKNRTRPFYMKVFIHGRGIYEGGSQISGEMGGCTTKLPLVQDCGLDSSYTVEFVTERITQDEITGSYKPDYITYDEKNGHYTNCQVQKGAGTTTHFRLVRKCNPDSGALCEALGRALKEIKAGRIPAASASQYQNLQQTIGAELSTARMNLCSDKAGAAKLEEIQQSLDSLSYVPGQSNLQNNEALGYIQTDLTKLIQSSCAVAPPSEGGSGCMEGSESKTAEDDALMKAFEPGLIDMLRTSAYNLVAYDKTKTCVESMFASGCVAVTFSKALGAAARTQQSGGSTQDVCEEMCNALGEWYDKSPCSKEGFTKATLISKCKLACVNPSWAP